MPLLEGPGRALLVGFLCTSTLGLGLRTTPGQLLAAMRDRGGMSRMLFLDLLVAPLLGLLIVRLWPLPPGPAAALLMLACAPGGLAALHFTRRLAGDSAPAAARLVVSTVLAVLVAPVLVRSLLPGHVEPHVPWVRLLLVLVPLVWGPIALGMVVGPRLAGREAAVVRLLTLASAVLFVSFMVTMKSVRKEALASIGAPAVAACLLLILGLMAAGWFLGGPDPDRRQMNAHAVSMRNVALVAALANDSPQASTLLPTLLAFSLLMVTPNTLFALWRKLLARRAARASA